jgi:hypothetical protein
MRWSSDYKSLELHHFTFLQTGQTQTPGRGRMGCKLGIKLQASSIALGRVITLTSFSKSTGGVDFSTFESAITPTESPRTHCGFHTLHRIEANYC